MAPHDGPDPHAQLPAALHALARVDSQATQVEPAIPQLVTAGVVQVSPMQQPLEQLVELHAPTLHSPLRQVWPEPQLGPVPQRHSPLPEQTFDRVASHTAQVFPPTPQDERLRTVQVEPTQQPDGQVLESQMLEPPSIPASTKLPASGPASAPASGPASASAGAVSTHSPCEVSQRASSGHCASELQRA